MGKEGSEEKIMRSRETNAAASRLRLTETQPMQTPPHTYNTTYSFKIQSYVSCYETQS